MSIKVNTAQLQSKSTYAASIASQLKEKVNQINSINYSLDLQIKSRQGIGSSLHSLQQRIEKAQQNINNISVFLSKTAEHYNAAETRTSIGPRDVEPLVGAAKVTLAIGAALGTKVGAGVAVAVGGVIAAGIGTVGGQGVVKAIPINNVSGAVAADKTDKAKEKEPKVVAKPADKSVQKADNSKLIDDAIKGVKGNATIIQGQGCLTVMGFPIGSNGINCNGVDASWGNMGKASTKLFQQMAGLPQTGELNAATLAKMKECINDGLTFKQLAKNAYANGIRPQIQKGFTQAQRTNAIYFYALIDEDISGVPAAITVAQAIQESNAGSSIPVDKYNGTYSYNMFGIKANSKWLKADGEYVVSNTWEHVNGKDIRVDAKFRAYDGYVESVSDHSKFFKDNGRYSSLFDIKRDSKYLENWARGLQKAGYATDPNYANQLIKHIKTYGLK